MDNSDGILQTVANNVSVGGSGVKDKLAATSAGTGTSANASAGTSAGASAATSAGASANANGTASSAQQPAQKQVYVTKTGKKYHYSSSCNGGTYTASTLSAARARGLTPCEKCVL